MKKIVVICCFLVTTICIGCGTGSGGKKDPAVSLPYVKVVVFGTLKARIFAIGGETTGYAVVVGKQTWELDFQGNEELIAKANGLNEKRILVWGRGYLEGGVVHTILVSGLEDGSISPRKSPG